MELFAAFFSSVYNPLPNSLNPPDHQPPDMQPTLDVISVFLMDIYQALSGLDVGQRAGPDGIPNIFLKECKCALTKPLHILFNRSLSLGVFLDRWKVSLVRPVFKKGDRHDITNYRPISILNSIPKFLESIIIPTFSFFIKPLLTDCQDGFADSKSTISNLALVGASLSETLDQGGQIDCLY